MEGKRIELNVEGTVVRTYVQSTYVHNTFIEISIAMDALITQRKLRTYTNVH